MAALTGKKPQDTYKDLLQVSNANAGVDATLRAVSDGEGTDSALSVSTTAARVTGTFDIVGSAAGTVSVGGATMVSSTPPTDPTTAPGAPSSVQNSVVAGTLAGTYQYKVAWVGNGGYEMGAAGTASASFTPDGTHKVYVGQPASRPSWATHWAIFRTKTGPTAEFYLLQSAVIVGSTYYLDDTDDSALVAPLAANQESSIGRRIYVGGAPFSLAAGGSVSWGLNALQYPGSGEYNTAVGALALTDNSGGYENVAVGRSALQKNTIGHSNTAVGFGALTTNTTGKWNTAAGLAALKDCTTGDDNTAIGDSVLTKLTTGSWNAGVGADTLPEVTTGSNNAAFGCGAGYSAPAAAAGNVFLGYMAAYYETGSNKLMIDNAKRASEADARVKALIYGVFDAATANQVIAINALKILMPYVPAYANNAAAVAALGAGALYYTDDSGEYILKISH